MINNFVDEIQIGKRIEEEIGGKEKVTRYRRG